MSPSHKIHSINFENDVMILNINNQLFKINISDISKKLSASDEATKNNYTISPSGYGIHWPQLDEDLSIQGLLSIAKQ